MVDPRSVFVPLVLAYLLTTDAQELAGKDVIVNDFQGFDDSILFDIDWTETKLFDPDVEEEYLLTDWGKHQYSCAIPRLETKEKESQAKEYSGRSPLDLIMDLFTSAACSFRAESYWAYEVCHGDYIKQYHEEREGKSLKVQEYMLGRWNKKRTEELRDRLAAAAARNEPVKYKKIESLSLPYVEVEMTDGTPCDLINGKPRQSRVLYVCYPHGKNEVYSLKEVSTCQYEVVILTQALCEHPSYKPLAAAEHNIKCSPTIDGSPVPPRQSWMTSAMMNSKLQRLVELKMEPEMQQFSRILTELDAAIKNQRTANAAGVLGIHSTVPTAPEVSGSKPFTDFISGVSCLTGGHGWWKYEFCYEKYVRQFHRHKNGDESSVILGKFNRDNHRAWLAQHPDRRPPKSVTEATAATAAAGRRVTLSHFYDEGTVCELTGQPRQTEVKLKCLEQASSPHQVQLYLLEPATCQYVLNVESPLICDLLKNVNEDGLVQELSTAKLRKYFGV